MKEVLPVLVKGLFGGGLVVAFALISEAVQPKRFAGIFGAAPAVAIAGLAVVLVSKGAHEARENSIGMLAGCAGMVVYAAVAARLVRGGRALSRTGLGIIAWIVPTAAVAAAIL